MNWLISVGDALSQTAGRFIWVRVRGQWTCWTDSPNESISGAAHAWALQGRFHRVESAIDYCLGESHCKRAFDYDADRAEQYLKKVKSLRGDFL